MTPKPGLSLLRLAPQLLQDKQEEATKAQGPDWAGLGPLMSVLPSPSVPLLNHTGLSTFHFESEELLGISHGRVMALPCGKEVRMRDRGPQELMQMLLLPRGQMDRLPDTRPRGLPGRGDLVQCSPLAVVCESVQMGDSWITFLRKFPEPLSGLSALGGGKRPEWQVSCDR